VKAPDIVPLGEDIAHDGLEMRPLGDEEIPQPVSPSAKPEPEIVTTVPGRPEVRDRVIPGVTRKFAICQSPIGYPVTFTT